MAWTTEESLKRNAKIWRKLLYKIGKNVANMFNGYKLCSSIDCELTFYNIQCRLWWTGLPSGERKSSIVPEVTHSERRGSNDALNDIKVEFANVSITNVVSDGATGVSTEQQQKTHLCFLFGCKQLTVLSRIDKREAWQWGKKGFRQVSGAIFCNSNFNGFCKIAHCFCPKEPSHIKHVLFIEIWENCVLFCWGPLLSKIYVLREKSHLLEFHYSRRWRVLPGRSFSNTSLWCKCGLTLSLSWIPWMSSLPGRGWKVRKKILGDSTQDAWQVISRAMQVEKASRILKAIEGGGGRTVWKNFLSQQHCDIRAEMAGLAGYVKATMIEYCQQTLARDDYQL